MHCVEILKKKLKATFRGTDKPVSRIAFKKTFPKFVKAN